MMDSPRVYMTLLAAIAMGAGCKDATTPNLPGVLTLLYPPNGAMLPQNNAAASCPVDSTRGSGITIVFKWAQPRDLRGRIAGYLVFAMNRGASVPIINNAFTPDTQFAYVNCNAFVIDQFLTGWEWKVRTMLTDNTLSDSSSVWTWTFAPCKLADGTLCHT